MGVDEGLAEIFRAAGHRVTSQRIALAEILRERGAFMDAETIHALAAARGEQISLATVYRTLTLFKEIGLIEGRIVGEDQNREEYRFRSSREVYTLACKRCGKIVPVEPELVEAFRRDLTQMLGVTVLSAHSCFIGYCADCTRIMANEE
jgi:Fur family transcriptional regulator, ferric uptake regulator